MARIITKRDAQAIRAWHAVKVWDSTYERLRGLAKRSGYKMAEIMDLALLEIEFRPSRKARNGRRRRTNTVTQYDAMRQTNDS
jgi:hypothetical protein